MHGLVVDRLEVDARAGMAEGHPQPVHDQRAAMRDRDAPSDAGRSEVLPSLEHLEQHALGLLVEREQPN